MRITTRLRVISAVTIAAFVVLAPVLVWSLIEFKNAKSDYVLSGTIRDNAFERTSFRDQYFLYREDRARVQWNENKETADSLLRQANTQFHGEENLQALERLHRNIEDSAVIFHRIVSNTEALRAAGNNRYVYEELDKRLASQLLLKAATIRDIASALQNASTRRVEQAYRYLTIIVGLFAIILALATVLTSVQLDRLIRKRLVPLHDGARIVADGDLAYRIQCDDVDEFAELALSINAMTESLQVSTKQLEAEISAHKSVEIALRDSEERLQMVLTGAEMATWDWRIPSGELIFNARWAEIQGYTLEELPPRIESWETRVFPDDMPQVREKLDRHFKGETPVYESEHRVRHKDGHWVWVLGRGKVIEWDGAGNPVHAVGTALDITERKQIENKLARAHAELQQFTHIAAHHLQEPARRLVSFAQRLRTQVPTELLNEDATASLHFIEQSATRQSTLVRDIQLYLAADQPRSIVEKIAVSPVITNLLEHKVSLMRETGAQVDYDNICSAYIDSPRLKDIFSILLDNALRYRHPKLTSHIRISGELKAGRAVYRVIDNGIGIPAEYRERVFGVFERLQVHEDQNSTGIGLAIVRRIVESCGGSVILQETPGGGTTVVLDLPG
ncbi:PAS domain-containing protein [Methylobacter sp.]|uniref:PAS domain-containing protein n=1 Tax=Methylobacter sp. TaxID=2051955 RepID=UPI001226BC95|nr:PAS domain-containing protein [Methylobacter sp.]TAK64887.1 MAG: PAS domain S-box protein [Methylobacter sp.]